VSVDNISLLTTSYVKCLDMLLSIH